MVQLVALVSSSLAQVMAECLKQHYFIDAMVNTQEHQDSYTKH